MELGRMRAQSAIEFLAAYTWAFLILAVVIFLLFTIVFVPSKGLSTYAPSSCYLTLSLPCYQSTLMTNSTGSQFIVMLQNNVGAALDFPANAISLYPSYSSNTVYKGSCLPQNALAGSSITCVVNMPSFNPPVGSQLSSTFKLNYSICPSCGSAKSQIYSTAGSSTMTVSPYGSILYTVQLLTNTGTGNIVVSGVRYPSGSNIILIAGVNYPIYAIAPSGQYIFGNWMASNLVLANPLQQITTAQGAVAPDPPACLQATFNSFVPSNSFVVFTSSMPTPGGSVSGGGYYSNGQTATVSESPSPGYALTGWSCAGSASSSCPSGTQSQFTFAVTGTGAVIANFAQLFSFSATSNSGGTLSCSPSCSGSYVSGTAFTVTANPSVGNYVSSISSCIGGTCTNPTGSSASGAITGNTVVSFTFAPISELLTVNNNGCNSVSGGGSYAYGTSAPFSATASTGYTFNGWTGSGTGSYTGMTNPNSVKMVNSISETAACTANSYTVTLSSSPSGAGTLSGGQSYYYGQNAIVSETPVAGYTFNGWTGCTGSAVCPSGTTNSFSFTVTSNSMATATYTQVPSCTSGGGLTCTETTNGLSLIDSFVDSGSSTGTWYWTAPPHTYAINLLVVAGGGAGGCCYLGGGGAGGLYQSTSYSYAVTPGTQYTVTVGTGGLSPDSTGTTAYANGANSQFGSTVTTGGGSAFGYGVGGCGVSGASGGSGGGGGFTAPSCAGSGNVWPTGGSNVIGQGYPGGGDTFVGCGGGGGGAGAAGTPYGGNGGGNGGVGMLSPITGNYYAGGGSGGGCPDAGGLGGGGGSNAAATPNTGGGGGGGGGYGYEWQSAGGYNGGSGIVIIQFLKTS